MISSQRKALRSRRRIQLAILLMFLGSFVGPVRLAAQVPFDVTADPPGNVASTGLSEVLSTIVLRAAGACGTSTDKACLSIGGTLQLRLTNTTIDNTPSTGMRICEAAGAPTECNHEGILLTGTATVNGDTLSIGVKDSVDLAAGDSITIAGVRVRVASSLLSGIGTDAVGVLSYSPPIGATFPSDPLLLARSADPLRVNVTSVPDVPCAFGDAIPTIQIIEGFPSAFVDFGDPLEHSFPGLPLLPRTALGGNANTRVRMVLTGLTPGVQIVWPSSIQAQNSGAVLDLIAQSSDGSSATYIYGNNNQLLDDTIAEVFAIRLNPINFNFPGTNTLSGIVGIQAQLQPPATPANLRPRYDHPLEPSTAEAFMLLRRCSVPVTPVGQAQVHASVDAVPWSGTLNYQLQGPMLAGGAQAPDTISNLATGNYLALFLSGGPSGATFHDISPSNVQSLTSSGIIDFTFNFTGPTIANLQLTAPPLNACPLQNAAVATFQLTNNTTDVQIIPAGTVLSITFSKLLITPPTVTGLGSVSGFPGASDVTYTLTNSLSLAPGATITFAGARLNLNGMANGQTATVLVTSTPSAALQLTTNQVVVATASTQACTPAATLSVTPSSILRGQSATLSWTSQNLTSLDIQPGIGSVQGQGSVSVSPSDTTTYVLTGQGPGGTAQATATLTVNAPPSLTLTVQPTTIERGQSATLSWTSQGATTLDLQPGIGAVNAQGSQSVSPTQTTTYTLSAQGPGGSSQVTATLTVTLPSNAPTFTAPAVTNGASFISGLVPGSITTVFGTRLSNVSGILNATTLPLPPQLSGTSVTVNGIAAPLFAVANVNGQEQINFQVPWEIAGQSSASIVVSKSGISSDPVTITPVTALPGVFTTDGNTGAILHGNGPALVTSANPAVPGEIVVIFATGLGPVTFTPPTGAAASGSPGSRTTITPTITIGGVPAPPDFSGLAPGFVGLYQVNVQIPSNVASGNQDLVIQVAGQNSKPVKIAIR